MKGIMIFRTLAEAMRDGFEIYEATRDGYLVYKHRGANWSFAYVRETRAGGVSSGARGAF